MQRQLLQKIGLLTTGLVLILIAGGCAPEADKPLEEVSYRLKWLFNISVVGDLYTNDSGLFTKNGLKVTGIENILLLVGTFFLLQLQALSEILLHVPMADSVAEDSPKAGQITVDPGYG